MLTRAAVAMAERGLVPDVVVAAGIRRLLRARLEQLQREGPPAAVARVVEAMSHAAIAERPDAANAQHYEVPADFFELWLGARVKYSCGYWPDGVSTLDAAESAMLDVTTARAGIADGMHVLDLGCGWGAFSLSLAERYPRCRITAVSNSRAQAQFIEEACRRRGLRHLKVITADINTFDVAERVDRIVCVEMMEHVRNYGRLLGRMASWLAEDGRVFVHIFCHRTCAYLFEARDDSDWMTRHFFSGGLMPSEDLLGRFAKHLTIRRHWRVDGRHYASTAAAWLAKLDARADEARAILASVYGERESARRLQRWRLFLLACRETFAFEQGGEWFVGHYLLEPV